MPTITKPNSKYSLLGSFTVTLLFVVLISKLISSVKKFCLMSADGTLLFPNLRTSGDTVCYQKFWEGGILKRSSPDPNSACFCRLAAGDTNQACSISTFHLSSLKITKVLSKWFCPCLKKHQQPQMKNQMQPILSKRKVFYLPCLNFNFMPNNAKTTWEFTVCKLGGKTKQIEKVVNGRIYARDELSV